VERLRAGAGSLGLVSGVGMHMTKHVFGVYGTEPGPLQPRERAGEAAVVPVVAEHDGAATVAAYSVVHGRDGAPGWALLVCETDEGTRTYARLEDGDECTRAEREELCGRRVQLRCVDADGPMGPVRRNLVAR
jgi:acetyl-CoA C-acetyltransferase